MIQTKIVEKQPKCRRNKLVESGPCQTKEK